MPHRSPHRIRPIFASGILFLSLALSFTLLSSTTWGLTPTASSWSPPQPGYRIVLGPNSPEGLYQLSYTDLETAGLPVTSLDPRTFQMFWMGDEIAIQVVGEADGHFDSGDAILFYGRNLDALFYDALLPTNKYTGDNIFWLSYGHRTGKRMLTVDAAPASAQAASFLHKVHLEENYFYKPAHPHVEGEDHWYWRKQTAYASGSTFKTYSFSTSHISTDVLTGALTIKLMSTIEDKTHDLALTLNNHPIYQNYGDWVGDTAHVVTVDVPQTYFVEGSNTIGITITNHIDSHGAVDEVYINWLEIAYHDTLIAENDHLILHQTAGGLQQYQIQNFTTANPAAYDISDLKNVKYLQNGVVTGSGPYTLAVDSNAARLLVTTPAAWLSPARIEPVTYPTSSYTPADLLSTGNAADYILITHADFWNQAVQLAAHRAADYDVALIDAQQIYDQFNGGMMSAEAIHDFLSYAYYHWAQRPSYVLLMGDGAYDMRHYKQGGFQTYIPIYLRIIGRITGETAAENRFVTIEDDATYGDLLADMALGRFPVNTTDEAQFMVDKTIAYETATCNPLPTDVLFVADDEESNLFWDYSDGVADGFADAPDNTIKYLPEPYRPVKKYLGKTCDFAADGNALSAQECNQQIIDKLNDTGALLVAYSGHATQNLWATEGMWTEGSVAKVTNTTACELPIMLTLACNEGYFLDPTDAAVSEVGVRQKDSGPVASISAPYYGYPMGHDALEKYFFLAVFNNDVKELGPALLQAKKHALDSNFVTEADGYMLMGDPALKIRTGAKSITSDITIQYTHPKLTWPSVAGVSQYDIYRAIDDPYFRTSGSLYASDAVSGWMDYDSNALGKPDHNYFYLIHALDASGNASYGPYQGEFDFALVPGN